MGDQKYEALLPAGSVPTDRVTLRVGALVVTDLHLAPLGDERTDEFVEWCGRLAGVPQLLVLGDLFDTWVGAKQAQVMGSKIVLDAFRALTERGTSVHLVTGNRDALIDGSFERVSGASVHMEGFVAELPGGGLATFVHGDSLCTLDTDYQRLRKIWRARPVRFISRHAPLWFARWVGGRLRKASEQRKPFKLTTEKSIRPAAIEALSGATGSRTVICGHAHEPEDQVVLAERGGPRWIVVGAWRMNEKDLLCIEEAVPGQESGPAESLGGAHLRFASTATL